MLKKLWILTMLIIPMLAAACGGGGASASNDVTSEDEVYAESQLSVTLVEEIGEGNLRGDLVWSPDSSRFIVGSSSGIWLFDNLEDLSASTGRLEGPVQVMRADFSPDGRHFASANGSLSTEARTIALYDGETGELLRELAAPETIEMDRFTDVVFHPNGETVLGLTDEGNILEFSVETGELVRDYETSLGSADRLIVSPDGEWLAHASSARNNEGEDRPIAQIISYETGDVIGLREHIGIISSIIFLPDNRLVTCDNNRIMKIWDTPTAFESGASASTVELPRSVNDFSVLPDGRLLVAGSFTYELDLETGEFVEFTAGGFISPDATYGAWRGETIRVEDAETGDTLSEFEAASYALSRLDAPLDGVLVGDFPGGDEVDFYNMESGEIIGSIESPGSSFQSRTFTPDGRLMAVVVSFDNNVYVYDTETYELVQTLEGHTDGPDHVSFSADGSRLVSHTSISDADPTVRVWNVETGEQIAVMTHEKNISRAIISPDGLTVVSSISEITNDSIDNRLYVWDATTGEQREDIKLTLPADRLGFSPDGSILVIGGSNLLARYAGWQFFDAESFNSTSNILRTGQVFVQGPVFSDDGTRMLTDLFESDLMVWDVATRQIIAVIPSHTENYYAYDFLHGSNNQIVTTDASGIMRVWEIGE